MNPVVIAAFEGWNDAADAASSVVDHLIGSGGPAPSGRSIPRTSTTSRSTARGRHRRQRPSPDHLAEHPDRGRLPPDLDRDVILLRGIEPNMRWRQFCAELLAACDDLGGELVVTLGALLADTPHTRPIPVTGTATEPELVDRLKLEQSTYEGPTGIVGVFQDACVRLDIPAVSLLGRRPPLRRPAAVPEGDAGAARPARGPPRGSIPLGELPEDARAWERGVDELAEEDEDIADYVRSLEETRDTADLPEASGEAIAREFERYLKRRATATTSGLSRVRRAAGPRAASSSVVHGQRRRPGRERVGEVPVRRGWPSTQASTAATARGASRSSASAASTSAHHRGGGGAGAEGERPAPGVERVDGVRELGVGPLPVACGSGGAAARAGSPSGRRRCCGARRRTPGCPGTWTSSRRRARPSRRARRPGERVLGSATWAWPAHISWCGKTRSLPPPCTSKSAPR